MSQIEAIYNAVLEGDAAGTKAGVNAALDAGIAPEMILKDGLIAAMGEVGRLFEENEYFVPEMLVSARAMQGGLAILKPHLAAGGTTPAGKVVVGTVKGDLHDIGKNLVAMMLEGAASRSSTSAPTSPPRSSSTPSSNTSRRPSPCPRC